MVRCQCKMVPYKLLSQSPFAYYALLTGHDTPREGGVHRLAAALEREEYDEAPGNREAPRWPTYARGCQRDLPPQK